MVKLNSLGIDYKAVLKGPFARMLVGQVKSIEKDGSRKVRCVKLSLDPKLHKFWNVRRDFRAADSHLDSDVGDMVLISQLVKPQGHLITHKVKEVIFKHGAVIDPITGRLCHGTNYAEDTVNSNFQKHVEKQAESEV